MQPLHMLQTFTRRKQQIFIDRNRTYIDEYVSQVDAML
jgi:hypothetical protein